MTDDNKNKPQNRTAQKNAARADALRANLMKRKQQSRDRNAKPVTDKNQKED
ncbi:MAG: hypothetical protein RBS08_09920 [Bdellovibrionales bacterium]|nr:hypothetical protein [Bdellovibrionales bacterium]